eukprot:91669_1
MWDIAEDFPFVIKDPNHPIHGAFVELRGFHTFINHTLKRIYCEGCGLFRYNNNGAIYDGKQSFGQPIDGAGTGSGLSWAGVVRKHDVLSGHIAHAIRLTFSGCDFMGQADNTHYVAPAIKTDQPKLCSPDTYPNDEHSVEMGYRFRLNKNVNCDTRLAPMIQNNGNWYPPSIQHTKFVRMFCKAVRDYGIIISDGAGHYTFATQGESDYPGDLWKDVFGTEIDDSTQSWTYMIRDQRSSNYSADKVYDNRYRDERYGVPWDQLQLLNVSTVGVVNNCCLNSNLCVGPTAAPTHAPYVDADTNSAAPKCTNENCCFKYRTILEGLHISDDNCVIYNNTFIGIHGNNMIEISKKRDGTNAKNTLIQNNKFFPTTSQDAIDILFGEDTMIKDNIFNNVPTATYSAISLHKSLRTTIKDNEFKGTGNHKAINFHNDTEPFDYSVNSITIISGNTFTNLKNGIYIAAGTDITITSNIFKDSPSETAIYWKNPVSGSGIYSSHNVAITSNTFTNLDRSVYVFKSSGTFLMNNNIITNMASHGIQFAGNTIGAVVSNNQISNVDHGIETSLDNRNIEINGNTIHTANVGLYIYSYNFNIVRNKIYNINEDRGVYVRSYGTINGNWIYNVDNGAGSGKDRGISTSADNAECSTNSLIIENNIIFKASQESIYLYAGNTNTYQKIIVRFNTLINQQSSYKTLNIASGLPDVDVYCNIFVDTTGDYHNTPSNTYFYNNLKQTATDYFKFVSVDMTNLGATSDFNLQKISPNVSPAIAYCNSLDTTTYPLSTTDISGITTRSTSFDIDVGAYQESPINTDAPTSNTSPPSSTPTSNSNSPTATTISPTSNTNSPTVTTTTPTSVSIPPSKTPTIGTIQPSYSPTITTSAPATTSIAPTINTGSPTLNTSPPTSITTSPSSNTVSPTLTTTVPTLGPTSVSGSPTSTSNSPTSVTTGPTSITTSPTSTPINPSGEPTCLNSACCHKNEVIICNDVSYCSIDVDNCVFWKCTISATDGSDVMKIITNPSTSVGSSGTIISDCTFLTTSGRDMIDIKDGKNTQIINNIFQAQTSSNYKYIRMSKSIDTTIKNNEFTGNVGSTATVISLEGSTATLTDNMNIYIRDNTFINVGNAIYLNMAKTVFIEDNIFKINNINYDAIRWKYGASTASADTVYIRRNTFTINCRRAIYVYEHANVLEIDSNTITTTNGHGIEFAQNSNGAVITNNIISNTGSSSSGLYIGSGVNSNMQIITNTIHTAGQGIYLEKGDNFLIKGNTIYNIGNSNGRGIHVKAYGEIISNIIYDINGLSKGRGIQTQGDTTNSASNTLLIENNIIFDTALDCINLYPGTNQFDKIIIRFNTIINTQNYRTIKNEANAANVVNIYCNINIDASGNYLTTPTFAYNNLQRTTTNINQIKFISAADSSNLGSNSDFHLDIGSPAIGYCNGLDTVNHPLSNPSIDKDAISRVSPYDVGAYVKISATSPPTSNTISPTSNTSPPTSITISPSSTTISPTSNTSPPTSITISPSSTTISPTSN